MLENKKFILSSLKDILQGAVNISLLNCKGIESFPLQEYILQSTFLKMTGYSEQKLKCICWDIASVDYDFRYKVYQHWAFGECSSADDKNSIFSLLVKKIQEYDSDFKGEIVKNRINDLSIKDKSYNFVKQCIQNSALRFFMERDFYNFSVDSKTFTKINTLYVSDTKILNNDLNDKFSIAFLYDSLYKHRNRCAHNLTSYQQNLPKINYLLKKDEKENYFYYFTVLIILDEVFKFLYQILLEKIKMNNW